MVVVVAAAPAAVVETEVVGGQVEEEEEEEEEEEKALPTWSRCVLYLFLSGRTCAVPRLPRSKARKQKSAVSPSRSHDYSLQPLRA